jgi:ATP-dependent exoDNAse (exonuclease V) alpha subunit
MISTKSPAFLLHQKFPFEPTPSQAELFNKLSTFILNEDEWAPLTFIIRGYAGTGKTTVISTLIKILGSFSYKTQLLAPTGRAAKVMANYSKKKASTIHKKIYRQVSSPNSGALVFQRMNNYATNTVFIVDEASMITDESDFGTNSLLTDLIEYVFTNPENGHTGNKLIFVGDTAQLPPVGKSLSPALAKDYISNEFHMDVMDHELIDVMRQDIHSGILYNATNLRGLLAHNTTSIQFNTASFKDFFRMTGEKMEDGMHYAYRKFGKEDTIVLTRSNKSAVQFNEFVRRTILYQEDEISSGDLLMIVRNNYHWLDEDSPAGFLANGDFVEVLKIKKVEEMHGFRFMNVALRLCDYEEHPEIEAKILLDTLHSAESALGKEGNKKLYDSVCEDYSHITKKKERLEAIRKDPYLNALQVKFAYALTTHKSQGGQWKAVFVEQGYLKDDQIDAEYIRWLYTAITRATHELFLVNFHERFFN